METPKVTPGIHSGARLDHFNDDEKNVIKKLSSDWYITNSGGTIKIGTTSSYKYFLLKPTTVYQELFNVEREIVAVFSDYSDFEPRTLDAFDSVINKYQELRIEKVCSVLISRDEKIEGKIRNLLKSDPEYQIIVPFNIKEIIENTDSFFFRNRFKEHFYSRDLFAFQSPLKKDLYFFGRTDLVHKLFNRHRSNENSGLFGLRKTGKTSIIFGIRRVMEAHDGVSVFVDCQNPSFHKKRWFLALRYVIEELKTQNKIKVSTADESRYSEENASTMFEKDLLKIYGKLQRKKILVIFDEIEQITPEISPSEHWKTDSDFVFFWQTLRSIFQKYDQLFTYLISGTNPKCVEIDRINNIDNPIFSQLPYEYIPSFDVPQTRDMVRKLGRIMGLQFDETIYSKLTEDFGGHPFLIRNVCSVISNLVSEDRPVRIDKTMYESGVKKFNEQYSSYIEMILTVLKEYYNDEYEMLKFLALDDIKTFNEFAKLSKEYTNHLLGYGILDRNMNNFTFKIDSVKLLLSELNKYKKINLSGREMLAEISERRNNNIEPKLREIVRRSLRQHYGENEAKKITLNIYGDPRKSKYDSFSYKEIFDPNKVSILFEDIRKIVEKNWHIFEHIFGKDKESFSNSMKAINKYRIDAHAKSITKEDMDYFRVCATKLETYINEQD